jgi:hypothetical protein
MLEQEYGSADERTLRAKNNYGMALNKTGDPVGASRIFEELRPLRQRAGDVHGMLATRGNNAAALLRQGRLDEAMQEFDAVFDGFIGIGNKYEALKVRGWQAIVLMEAGNLRTAEAIQRGGLQRSQAEGSEFNVPAFIDGLLTIWSFKRNGLRLNRA